MSYQEKRTVTNIFALTLLLVAYCLYAFPRNTLTSGLRGWALAMLVFMGVGIVLMIIVQVLFHIFFAVGIAVDGAVNDREVDDTEIESTMKSEMVEDERDRIIELKSGRIGMILSGLGFFAGLVALALNYPAALMLNILYFAFVIGSIAEEIGKLVYYRRDL